MLGTIDDRRRWDMMKRSLCRWDLRLYQALLCLLYLLNLSNIGNETRYSFDFNLWCAQDFDWLGDDELYQSMRQVRASGMGHNGWCHRVGKCIVENLEIYTYCLHLQHLYTTDVLMISKTTAKYYWQPSESHKLHSTFNFQLVYLPSESEKRKPSHQRR